LAYLPGLHCTQATALDKAAIVPGTHVEHVEKPEEEADVPGEHESQRADRTRRELAVPGVHKTQSLGVLDAPTGDCFPAPQGVHEEEPVEVE